MNDITEAVGEHYRMEAELAQIAVRRKRATHLWTLV